MEPRAAVLCWEFRAGGAAHCRTDTAAEPELARRSPVPRDVVQAVPALRTNCVRARPHYGAVQCCCVRTGCLCVRTVNVLHVRNAVWRTSQRDFVYHIYGSKSLNTARQEARSCPQLLSVRRRGGKRHSGALASCLNRLEQCRRFCCLNFNCPGHRGRFPARLSNVTDDSGSPNHA